MGIALEMYISEQNKTTQKYLSDNLTAWLLNTPGTECILERLVRLKIIKDEDLNSFLESTDESMIKTRAAILERMKDQKINLRKFIL